MVDSTIKMGADIIIGGHPHVLQPIQFIKSNKNRPDSVFVAYSLGNFISNQQWRYSDAGGILTLRITKNLNDNSIRISEVEFIPTRVFKGNTGIKHEYIILPSISSQNDSSITFFTKSDHKRIEESLNDTRDIISKFSLQISFR